MATRLAAISRRGGLRPTRETAVPWVGEVTTEHDEILISRGCRDADRQVSADGSSSPNPLLTTRRRSTQPGGAFVIGEHPLRLGLHGQRVMDAAGGDVTDTGLERFDDMPWCGAVALLVHLYNPLAVIPILPAKATTSRTWMHCLPFGMPPGWSHSVPISSNQCDDPVLWLFVLDG